MFKRAGALRADDRSRLEPPPPGQMTDPDYDETSLVGYPANGRFFLVRKGGKLSFERLSEQQIAEMTAAGLAPPQSILDVVKDCVQSVLTNMFPQQTHKGEPMDPQAQNNQTPAPAGANETPAPAPVKRELEDGDIEQVREIVTEVVSGILDERLASLSTIEERLKALEDALASGKEETAEMQKSFADFKASTEKDVREVKKSLEFRPAGQGDDDRGPGPNDPATVQKQQSQAAWEAILVPKKGA